MNWFDPHYLLYTVVFLAVVLAAEAVILHFAGSNSAGRVNKRMRLLADGATNDEVISTLRRGSAPTSFTVLPSLTGYLEKRLVQAGSTMPIDRLFMLMTVTVVVVSLAFLMMAGVLGKLPSLPGILLFLMLGLAFGVGAPIMYLSAAAATRMKKFEKQFPVALDIFVRGLRAGYPVSAALELLVTEVPDPSGSEFGLVVSEMNYGYDLRESLAHLARRIQTTDINMFAVCVSIQSETGGNLADILDGLSKVIRDRASMVLKVNALAAEGKITGMLLAGLPVAAFSFLMVSQPRFYLDVADDRWFMPGVGIILSLYAVALITIKKMIAIKV